MHSLHIVTVGVWSMQVFFREIQMLSADDALMSWNTEIFSRNPHFSSLLQSLCFRIQKMMEVYKPDWCETREEWSVYLFSPQNKWVHEDYRTAETKKHVLLLSLTGYMWKYLVG